MDRFVRSFKVFWRSERFLTQKEFGLAAQKIQMNALAALIAVFGLVMLSLSIFFALLPYFGQSLAALCVAGIDFFIALGLIMYSGSLKLSGEVEIVREMRDMALKDIEQEVALAETELTGLKEDARRLIRNPLDVLLPTAIGQLLNTFLRGDGSSKKQAGKAEKTTSSGKRETGQD